MLANSTITIAPGTNGTGTSDPVALGETLTINGTNNEIDVAVGTNTLTIGLPADVTISQDLIVSRNLTVQGTASFQNTTNLDVADRFILLASGSNTTGDGGIVIQQGTNGIGEGFGYDSAETRWGVTGSFDGSQATFVPDAFMAAVVVAGAGVNDPSTAPARYVKDEKHMCSNEQYQAYKGTAELVDDEGNQIKDPSKWCSNWFLPKEDESSL